MKLDKSDELVIEAQKNGNNRQKTKGLEPIFVLENLLLIENAICKSMERPCLEEFTRALVVIKCLTLETIRLQKKAIGDPKDIEDTVISAKERMKDLFKEARL